MSTHFTSAYTMHVNKYKGLEARRSKVRPGAEGLPHAPATHSTAVNPLRRLCRGHADEQWLTIRTLLSVGRVAAEVTNPPPSSPPPGTCFCPSFLGLSLGLCAFKETEIRVSEARCDQKRLAVSRAAQGQLRVTRRRWLEGMEVAPCCITSPFLDTSLSRRVAG